MIRRGDPRALVRRLLIVPILHTEADMGDLASRVRDRKLQVLGFEGYRRSQRRVSASWDVVEAFVENLPARLDGYNVYQDGLPVCGREPDIVAELAAGGSRNHRLILVMCRRGAQLVGTESPELLREELELARHAASRAPAPRDPGSQGRENLLLRRDRFIAARITATLKPGRTGILFVGLLHDVARHLPQDIVVETPISPLAA